MNSPRPCLGWTSLPNVFPYLRSHSVVVPVRLRNDGAGSWSKTPIIRLLIIHFGFFYVNRLEFIGLQIQRINKVSTKKKIIKLPKEKGWDVWEHPLVCKYTFIVLIPPSSVHSNFYYPTSFERISWVPKECECVHLSCLYTRTGTHGPKNNNNEQKRKKG